MIKALSHHTTTPPHHHTTTSPHHHTTAPLRQAASGVEGSHLKQTHEAKLVFF
jgi:hypothetical protein